MPQRVKLSMGNLRETVKNRLNISWKRRLRMYREAIFRLLECTGERFFMWTERSGNSEVTPLLDPAEIKKLLIFRTDRIGDVVLSTPAFRAVRKRVPTAEITLVCKSYTKPLVDGLNLFDDIVCVDRYRGVLGKLRLIRQLRKKRCNLTLVFYTTFWIGMLAYFCRSPIRVGYRENGGGFWMTHKLPPQLPDQVCHEVKRTLAVIEVVGIPVISTGLSVSVSTEGEQAAKRYFEKHAILETDILIAVHPGSRQVHLRWSADGFAKTSNLLLKDAAIQIILIGSREERELIRSVYSRIWRKDRVHIANSFTLSELVGLLKNCSLFIGNSTGPMHIAAALGIPVVAIFGLTHPYDSPTKWRPWSERSTVVTRRFGVSGFHPSDMSSSHYMNQIKPEDVYVAAMGLLESYYKRFQNPLSNRISALRTSEKCSDTPGMLRLFDRPAP